MKNTHRLDMDIYNGQGEYIRTVNRFFVEGQPFPPEANPPEDNPSENIDMTRVKKLRDRTSDNDDIQA